MFVFSLAIVACGPSKEDAVKYNDAVTEQVNSTFDKYAIFTDAANKINHDTGDYSALDKPFSEYKTKVDSALKAVNAMPAFNNKTEMKDAAVKLLTTFKNIADKDWTDLITLVKKEGRTEEENAKMKESGAKIDDEMNKVQQEFVAAQAKFAKEWKFELK